MMYHFMFGLRGASVAVVAPSAGAACPASAPAVDSFFSSSCIVNISSRPARVIRAGFSRLVLMSPEEVKQGRHALLDEEINHPKIEREDCDRNNDNGGRRAHFFPRRRGDLAHFRAHVGVERLDAFRPGLDPLSKAASRGNH